MSLEEMFIYFLIYAFIGWLLEVCCKIIELKKFINRGFLIGPICPIYGLGVLFMITLIGEPENIIIVFSKSILICSILEYFTSYIMEKLFKARWWDYSRRKYNLNGRICLDTMIPFGLLGVFVVYILHPIIKGIVGLLNHTVLLVIAIILAIIFIVDFIVSMVVMFKIKHQINDNSKDNTEYVREKVFEWIESNSYLYRRIRDSFPDFEIRSKIKKQQDKFVDVVLTTSEKVNTAKEITDEKVSEVKEVVTDTVNNAKEITGEKLNEVKEAVTETVNTTKDAMIETATTAKEVVSEKVNEVKENINNLKR